jgi:hypothetical protein
VWEVGLRRLWIPLPASHRYVILLILIIHKRKNDSTHPQQKSPTPSPVQGSTAYGGRLLNLVQEHRLPLQLLRENLAHSGEGCDDVLRGDPVVHVEAFLARLHQAVLLH